MDSVLIVSSTEKGASVFMEMLAQQSASGEIVTVSSGGLARRRTGEREFDLCIVNAPLSDEFGDDLAVRIAMDSATQVLLMVRAELYDGIAAKVEDAGVFTLQKPFNKSVFWNTLKLAQAAHNKLTRLKRENTKLLKQIEDIRLVDRAKCLLIQNLAMTEREAHRYIEKQAMDMRQSKTNIAQSILRTYEN